jgi:hypothetical protein
MMWSVLFFATTFALFATPLLPAFLEWRHKTDARPLNVVRNHGGSATHFAESFRKFVEKRFTEPLNSVALGAEIHGETAEGSEYAILGENADLIFRTNEARMHVVRRLIAARGNLQLPSEFLFESELYARGDIHGMTGSAYRALLSEGNIHLGDASSVLRWAHAERVIRTGDRSKCHGRLTATQAIFVGRGTEFLRLKAPNIAFGDVDAAHLPLMANDVTKFAKLPRPDKLTHAEGGRWLIRGDFTVAKRHFHRGDMVTTGELRLESNVWVCGGLKSNRDLYIGEGVRIDGPVIATGNLVVGENCQILGPLVSEQAIHLGAGTRIGAPDRQTTISALRLIAAPSVFVHGSVWVREHGEVTA